MPQYLGARYFGPRYWSPRYFGGAAASPPSGPFEIYDGTVNVRPLGGWNLAKGSDNAVELVGLRGEFAGQYPPDATVTFTLADPTGAPVSSAQDVTMPHIVGLSGPQTTYRGVLRATVSVTLSRTLAYTLTITAVDANGNKRVFSAPCPVLPG